MLINYRQGQLINLTGFYAIGESLLLGQFMAIR